MTTIAPPAARPSNGSPYIANVVQSVWYLARSTLYRRYCGSWAGLGWSLLNPISQILIYYMAFALFIRVAVPNYFLFLISGLLPWFFINNTIMVATGSLVARVGVINATTINHLIFVLTDTTVELFTLLISLAALLAISAILVHPPTTAWFGLILAIIPLALFCYGIALAIAYLAARFRDLAHLLQISMSALFWLMPIIYHWSTVPAPYQFFVQYNPLALLITPFQVLIHGDQMPSIRLMFAGWLIAAASIAFGSWVYHRMRRDIIFFL